MENNKIVNINEAHDNQLASRNQLIDVSDGKIGTEAVVSVMNRVQDTPVFKKEDITFLMEKSKHLGMVMENTFMWRTDFQKRSIISDMSYPTNHSKYHQSILEQKVQFDQAMYLAKDYRSLQLDLAEKECELEDLIIKFKKAEAKKADYDFIDGRIVEKENKNMINADEIDFEEDEVDIETPIPVPNTLVGRRIHIKIQRLQDEIAFINYQINQAKIAMKYRMSEVKGWQIIEEELIEKMHEEGLTDAEIWSKEASEMEYMFFSRLDNLHGIKSTTDGGEHFNLVSLAKYSYDRAKEAGLLETYRAKCTSRQLEALAILEDITCNPRNARHQEAQRIVSSIINSSNDANVTEAFKAILSYINKPEEEHKYDVIKVLENIIDSQDSQDTKQALMFVLDFVKNPANQDSVIIHKF